MRAAGGVDAALGQHQPLYGTPGDQVLAHDLLHIRGLNVAVPDGFRIDDDRRPVLTLVEAAGLVGADAGAEAGSADGILKQALQLSFAIGGAGRTGAAWFAGIGADKDVMFKSGQTKTPQNKRSFHVRDKTSWPGRIFTPSISYTVCLHMEPLNIRPDNLHSTKDDMIAFIEGHGMRRLPGHAGEEVPSILWEDETNPDSWKDFVEMAKAAGAPFVTMSEVVLEKEDVELLIEELQEHHFPDDEAPEMDEAQALVTQIGKTGYIQLGFAHQGVMFLHENATDWYERYQQLLESVEDFSDIVFEDGDGDEEEEQ